MTKRNGLLLSGIFGGLAILFIMIGCGGGGGDSGGTAGPGPDPTPTYWTKQFGTSTDDSGYVVVADSAGNIYVAGKTWGTISGTSAGAYDVFVAKYDVAGVQKWVVQFGTANSDEPVAIKVDGFGNLWLAYNSDGGISQVEDVVVAVKLDPSSGASLLPSPIQLTSLAGVEIKGLAVDANNNVYIGGDVRSSLDGAAFNLRNNFVAKYDNNGVKQWFFQFVGTNAFVSINRMTADSNGNVYLAGQITHQIHAAGDYYDVYLAKVAGNGTSASLSWQRDFGSTAIDSASDIIADAAGNVYLAGKTEGALGATPNAGGADYFLAKYDQSGNKLWLSQDGSSGTDIAMRLALDTSGNIYLTGYTDGVLDGVNAGHEDIFLAKYSNLGAKQWTRQFGTNAQNGDKGKGVAVSGDNIYITGNTYGGLDGNTNAGSYDVFIAKYAPAGTRQ